jgi:uncharacterized protein YkwD
MAPPLPIALLAALAGALMLALALGPAAGGAAAAKCSGADRPAARMSGGKAERLTLCLLNKQRAKHGLKRLREQKNQDRAASRHNRRMVRKACFSHECPGEPDLVGRLTKAGYLPCGCSWMVGENIAWGSGSYGSPRRIVGSWMKSAGHRENILNPRFEHIGVAVTSGSPGGGYRDAATYTTDFGFKSG